MRIKAIFIVVMSAHPAFAANVDEGEKWFQAHVAPILQQHCFECHNSTDKKGDFSLQTLHELSDSGFVVEGDPQASHLLQVLKPADGKRAAMPKDNPPLDAAELAAIEKWIQLGAPWPVGLVLEQPVVSDKDWWSWNPLLRPDVPRDANPFAEVFPIRTTVDQFILQKLLENKLTPSAPAGRRDLIRRVTYDLTGLPPSPSEVARFVIDDDPLAYDKLIDRLLASPAYGEHWGRHWLDVVKYADTCGYDKDKLRPHAWPYRDYVIRSFNADKPYGQFTREQIAGDKLYPNTADGILGLGFIAAGPWDFIGHAEVAEQKLDGQIARNIDRDEMVTNTMNTFASTTIQCARCHNHKFDAVSQQHYYNLQSVFAAVDKANRMYDLDPAVERKKVALEQKIVSVTKAISDLQAQRQNAAGEAYRTARDNQKKWEPAIKRQTRPVEYGFHSKISKSADTTEWVQVDLGSSLAVSKIRLYPASDDFGGIGDGFGFPVRFRISISSDPEFKTATVVFDQTAADFSNPKLAFVETTFADGHARYVRITATRLAKRANDYIMVLSEIAVMDKTNTNLAQGKAVTASSSIEAPDRWGKKNATDGLWPTPADIDGAQKWLVAGQAAQVLWNKAFTAQQQQRQEALRAELSAAQTELESQPAGALVYAAATHFETLANFKPTMGTPREIRVLGRGDILRPGAVATPGTIPVLSNTGEFELPTDHDEADRRVALAQWLTRPDQPLTWRSIVNRIWQHHFGRGIVNTPNDFGRMGQPPTHPELLDWLAVEFRDQGQSIKALHRMIVQSSVYRQSSHHHPANYERDDSNQFLWRMNRRRLTAEEIRDSILFTSGRLNRRMGGPGFYLFVLEHPQHSPHYEYHKHDPADPQSHRRSVYRFVVRSQPDPFMTILDCADSSQSTPVRDETLTSIQALALLNNKFNLAMAEFFKADLSAQNVPLASQVDRAFRRVTGRVPTAEEHAELVGYAQEHGITNLCRLLYNFNEFIYLD